MAATLLVLDCTEEPSSGIVFVNAKGNSVCALLISVLSPLFSLSCPRPSSKHKLSSVCLGTRQARANVTLRHEVFQPGYSWPCDALRFQLESMGLGPWAHVVLVPPCGHAFAQDGNCVKYI